MKNLVSKLEKTNSYPHQRIKYLSNLALFISSRDYNDKQEAIKYIDEAINMSLELNNYLYLFDLYYNHAILMYQFNDIDKFKESIHKAYELSKSQNIFQIFKDSFIEDINKYHIDKQYIEDIQL